MAKIVLHLKAGDLSPDLKGWHLRLYRVIADMCAADGIECVIRQRDKDIKIGTRTVRGRRFDDGNLHIIDDRSVTADNVLNAGVAYFWEFWHLDPIGTKAFSSIGARDFDPDAVSPQRAATFADNLRKRYLEQRRSKYKQPDVAHSFPSGAVSVFFQGGYPIQSGATTFSDLDVLLAVQAGAGDRAIMVKPHPLSSHDMDRDMVRQLARQDPRIQLTDANVHDILAASAITASINSTVALEGFMHGVPALLFGQSDFQHAATTITDPAQIAPALQSELDDARNFDAFLAWYFLKNCIPLNSGKLHDKIWGRFGAAGFSKDRFV